jgi:hypothetical protein
MFLAVSPPAKLIHRSRGRADCAILDRARQSSKLKCLAELKITH